MTRRRKITILLCAFLLCFISALAVVFAPTRATLAEPVEDQALQSAIDAAGFSVNDGAKVSTQSPYILRFDFTIPTSSAAISNALDDALQAEKDSYFILSHSGSKVATFVMLFQADMLPYLNENLAGVELDWTGRDNPGKGTLLGNTPLLESAYDDMHLDIDGYEYYPTRVFTGEEIQGGTGGGAYVSLDVGKENINTEYVPILVVYAGYYTAGPLWMSAGSYHATKLVYNPNAERSVTYVSNRILEDESYWENEDEQDNEMIRNVLLENTEGNAPVFELEETDTVKNLIASNPLGLQMVAGATYNENANGLSWRCQFNAVNFDVWKQTIKELTLWWIIVDFDSYASTGETWGDFQWNMDNAKRVIPEVDYILNGEYYESTITYVPEESDADINYIAIPFIKAVGYKSAADTWAFPFEGITAGTYITCEARDNFRSVAYFIEPKGPFVYTFTYLEALEGKPFALKKTKTITLDERIDFNTFTKMKQFADLIGLETKEGNITCLMSRVNWWTIEQTSANNYNIGAMYSLIPLTFRNDKNEVESQELGLIPFTNIDTKNLYAQQLTSLKDKEGKPYFETLHDVETSDLYGYFYTYSYESEYEDPNWQLNPNSYNGSIVYFTELEKVEYKTGYMEAASIGAIPGAIAGAIVGTLVGGIGGLIVGVATGGLCGAAMAGGLAALFGAEQDSTSVYYNIEYGFLDCSTMTPGNGYDTEKDPELQEWEKIILAVVAIFEVVILFSVAPKFKVFGWIGILIGCAAIIAGFVWADIALYNFLLTGI